MDTENLVIDSGIAAVTMEDNQGIDSGIAAVTMEENQGIDTGIAAVTMEENQGIDTGTAAVTMEEAAEEDTVKIVKRSSVDDSSAVTSLKSQSSVEYTKGSYKSQSSVESSSKSSDEKKGGGDSSKKKYRKQSSVDSTGSRTSKTKSKKGAKKQRSVSESVDSAFLGDDNDEMEGGGKYAAKAMPRAFSSFKSVVTVAIAKKRERLMSFGTSSGKLSDVTEVMESKCIS